jgi:rare lipoprotein A
MSNIPSLIAACGLALATVFPAHAADLGGQTGGEWSETGRASFYGKFWQGRRTASGERFDNGALTAAHAWLPFGTRVRVIVEETGREVVVTITDRLGTARRVIDLSQQAARLLGIVRQGTAHVTLARE